MEAAEKAGDLNGRKENIETLLMHKVAEVSSTVAAAYSVDDVVCALHSLAVFLFPVDSVIVAGCLGERYRRKVLDTKVPIKTERDAYRHAFYEGAAFPTMARLLLYDIARDWLACFPSTARVQVYDSFFIEGPAADTFQALMCSLNGSGCTKDDLDATCSNTERLLVSSLLKTNGAYSMAVEMGSSCNKEYAYQYSNTLISRMAQLLASVPDKARAATSALSSHSFFKHIIVQLLVAAEETAKRTHVRGDSVDKTTNYSTFSFVGQTFGKICRRGSSDVLAATIIPRIVNHVRNCVSSNCDPCTSELIKSRPESIFWLSIMEEIKDLYAMERLCEQLLHQLSTVNVRDEDAYWVLWMLFHSVFECQVAIRTMFCERFLLWKVFPLCCLKWILQFSLLECPPSVSQGSIGQNTKRFLDVVQRMIGIWSKREFVQTTSMEQQAYISAAIGLSLERMSKEELETTGDVLHSILQGVTCRLESPDDLIRKMASSIALVFSKIIDPKNPLYLDDSCDGTVDWGFGGKGFSSFSVGEETHHVGSEYYNIVKHTVKCESKCDMIEEMKDANVSNLESRSVDPDEVVDPAILINGNFQVERGCYDDDCSESSESSSDSFLQPYDLTDDVTDLQRKFSQLGDLIAALRKTDDLDGVEKALDVAEKLIRALPDELQHIAGDLAGLLIRIRCSDLTVEGEEQSAESKREKALIALLVTCPFESLNTLNKLLYSSNVDVSQRILIIDVMTHAAQELADTRIMTLQTNNRDLISPISGKQPWFLPSSKGPSGAGPWKEVSESDYYLSWSCRYERELPSKSGQLKGKSRRWNLKTAVVQDHKWSKNKFPLYAAAFMLPAMQGFDRHRHGVNLLNKDFILLGRLIYMLGVCIKCTAMHPEASVLASPLLDMLSYREICHHTEAYVRRSVLFAASCILVSLHPSYVASTMIEGNQDIAKGLDWIRTWALHISESDSDTECSSMAVKCLLLHAEMVLQTSRAVGSVDYYFKGKVGSGLVKTNEIVMPFPAKNF